MLDFTHESMQWEPHLACLDDITMFHGRLYVVIYWIRNRINGISIQIISRRIQVSNVDQITKGNIIFDFDQTASIYEQNDVGHHSDSAEVT